MNSTAHHEPAAPQFNGSVERKCFICHYPVGEHCFCKVHTQNAAPIMLCCPDCTMQYLDSKLSPDDAREQEFRAYERNIQFFIGENKPWS